MNANEIQQYLFQAIKTKLPADASVADEVAGLLKISSDSVYRRMRGEKEITLKELYEVATHYNISLDHLMNLQSSGYTFQGKLLNPQTFRFDAYLTTTLNNLAYFNSFKEKEYYYLCKDTPIFYHFLSRNFAAFKYFFWMGTLIYFPEFRNKKVALHEYADELWELGQKIVHAYNQLDSYEVWNLESLNSTLHQIEYYRDGQRFNNDSDAVKVYEAVKKMIDHVEKQAELGYKFDINDPGKKPLGRYHLYFNDIVLLDNSMMAVLDKTKIAVQPHTSINYMMTRDLDYSENFYQYFHNLTKRSTQISEVSEKERTRFFRLLHERIDRRIERRKDF